MQQGEFECGAGRAADSSAKLAPWANLSREEWKGLTARREASRNPGKVFWEGHDETVGGKEALVISVVVKNQMSQSTSRSIPQWFSAFPREKLKSRPNEGGERKRRGSDAWWKTKMNEHFQHGFSARTGFFGQCFSTFRNHLAISSWEGEMFLQRAHTHTMSIENKRKRTNLMTDNLENS
jgi:hypothetical protein